MVNYSTRITSETPEGRSATFRVQLLFFFFFEKCGLNCCTISGYISFEKKLFLSRLGMPPLEAFFSHERKEKKRKQALRASLSVATPTNQSFRVCKVILATPEVAIVVREADLSK